MNPEEVASGLEAEAAKPENAARRDRILGVASALRAKASPASTGRPGELGGEGPPAGPGIRNPPEKTLGERAEPFLQTVARAGSRLADTATFGAYSAATDLASRATGTHIGTSPEQAAEFQQQHPWLGGAADAAGNLVEGLPKMGATLVGRGVDALTSILARRATGPVTRIAARVGTDAAKAVGTAALASGSQAIGHGRSPREALDEAAAAAQSPYSWGAGAGLGALAGAGAEGATRMRAASPDLQILDKYGLEPGPVPGRPVIRQDTAIGKQLPGISGEPPLGISRATPQTRGAAGRSAADVILPDMAERSRVNNQRFGEMQREAYTAEGANPSAGTPVLNAIDAHLQSLRLPASTRGALEDLRAKVVGNGTSTRGGHFVSAEHMDQLRDYADGLGRQEKAAKASDVPLRQVADIMRASVAEAAPGIAHLNALQHDVLSGFEERRGLLGVPKSSERTPNERTARAVGQRLRQAGEETATAGAGTTAAGNQAERLSALGPPELLPDANTSTLGPEPNYKAHLDVPRLQLAQENIQLTPSKAFSGAKAAGERGLLLRMAQYAPERVGYPLMRRLGDSSIGAKPLAADALIQALRSRGRKRQEERP